MRNLFKLLSLMVMFLLRATVASADVVPTAAPLETIVAHSDLIVVGKLIKMEKNPAWQFNSSKSGRQLTRNGGVYLSVPGRYEFKVLYTIKGAPQPRMVVILPAVDSMMYGWAEPNIAVGGNDLLFLKRSRGISGYDLLPTDPMLPSAVLDSSDNQNSSAVVIGPSTSMSALQQVCSVLLNSMHDNRLLQANTYLLRDIVNPMIPKRLMSFIDDPRERIQSNVLACLATNQVVGAIPRIAQLHAKILAEDGAGGCVEKLEEFRTKEAVPYLNPLLFSPCDAVRFCASMALRKVADATSIPYLIAGLADPDITNKYECYATLTRLIPQLGDQKTLDKFEENPNVICLPYLTWWQDELKEKHIQHIPGAAPLQ